MTPAHGARRRVHGGKSKTCATRRTETPGGEERRDFNLHPWQVELFRVNGERKPIASPFC